MKKKLLIPIMVLVAAAVVLAPRAVKWFSGDDGKEIRLSGNLEMTQVNIAFKISGKMTERTVNEGDVVKRGQVIARLDREQLERQKEREQATLAGAQSTVTQLLTLVQWQGETLAGDGDLRKAELALAEARLKELLAGARSQEKQQARAAVEEARAEAERAKKDWDRAQALFKSDDITAAQHDQFRTRFEASSATLRRLEQQAALVEEGPRQEEIEMARAQVARAKASLRLSDANRLELRRKQEDVTTRRTDVERARAQLALIESQLGDTVAVSPVDGIVLVKSAEPEEVLAAGTTVVTIADLEHPWLRAYIREQDLGRVKIGSKAKVTTDSYPGKSYSGRVTFISSEAEFTPKQIQTPEERVKLVYRIKVDVENTNQELKSNMPADAEILASEK